MSQQRPPSVTAPNLFWLAASDGVDMNRAEAIERLRKPVTHPHLT